MMLFNFSFAYYTHQGKVRPHNEDALLVASPIPDLSMTAAALDEVNGEQHLILGVADGIGGANAGEVASEIVVQGLSSIKEFQQEALEKKLQELNQQIHSLAQADEKVSGMGAAVAGMAFSHGLAWVYHVGDCRVYRIKDGFFQQLTEDDTTAQVLVRAGKLDPDAIRGESQHGLLQALGGRRDYADITPHVRSFSLQPSERFMVCSDGITDFMSLDVLEELVLPELSVDVCAQRLIAASSQTAQKDNVSFILFDVMTESGN